MVEVAHSCSQRCVPTQSSKAHLVPAQYWTFYPSVKQKKKKTFFLNFSKNNSYPFIVKYSALLTIGTLRSDKGDTNENVAEK